MHGTRQGDPGEGKGDPGEGKGDSGEGKGSGRPWRWACLPGETGEAMEDLPFAPAPGASFGLGPVLGGAGTLTEPPTLLCFSFFWVNGEHSLDFTRAPGVSVSVNDRVPILGQLTHQPFGLRQGVSPLSRFHKTGNDTPRGVVPRSK